MKMEVPKKLAVTINLNPEPYDKLKRMSQEYDMSMAAIVRQLINQCDENLTLKKNEPNTKI